MNTHQDGLSAGEVARHLGVAVTTVRSWDRRYGLGPEQREPGRHRRYQDSDLVRLQLMRRLLDDGVAAAEAARLARSTDRPHTLLGEANTALDELPESPARARGLYRAAAALDKASMERLLSEAFTCGVVAAWSEVICPTLRHIGDRHAITGRYVEVEHMLSTVVSTALARATAPRGRPQVLLACTPDELHTLPLEALTAALAENGTASWQLGARVPSKSLRTMLSRTDPAAVVLWAHTEQTVDHDQLEQLLAARPRPPIVAACGPGWTTAKTPHGVHTPTTLAEAVELLTAS